jgi:hypothetical protein
LDEVKATWAIERSTLQAMAEHHKTLTLTLRGELAVAKREVEEARLRQLSPEKAI